MMNEVLESEIISEFADVFCTTQPQLDEMPLLWILLVIFTVLMQLFIQQILFVEKNPKKLAKECSNALCN